MLVQDLDTPMTYIVVGNVELLKVKRNSTEHLLQTVVCYVVVD